MWLELRLRWWFEVDGFGGDERRERFATEIGEEREVRRTVEREFGVGGGGERETEEVSCSCHFWT